MPSPSGATPTFGFPYPLETDVPDIPTWGEDLALAIEQEITDAQGIFADIPAAGKAGRFYFATDYNVLLRDNGTHWTVQPGTVLASKLLTGAYNVPSPPTTFALIDSSNAKLTFPVPASGKVLLQESGLFNVGTAAETITTAWSSAATNNANLIGNGADSGYAAQTTYTTMKHVVSGLTPGAVVTAYLQWAESTASGGISLAQNAVLEAIAL